MRPWRTNQTVGRRRCASPARPRVPSKFVSLLRQAVSSASTPAPSARTMTLLQVLSAGQAVRPLAEYLKGSARLCAYRRRLPEPVCHCNPDNTNGLDGDDRPRHAHLALTRFPLMCESRSKTHVRTHCRRSPLRARARPSPRPSATATFGSHLRL